MGVRRPPSGRRRRASRGGHLIAVSGQSFDRGRALARLADETFDILVIGGGITGAGVALDAATRGMRVALVERHDFASGTSSKSSKLVHGGLRYLQQHEYRLVYEALYERQRALENAPHLVHVLPFLVPVLRRGGLIDHRLARVLGTALWMYDLTGGVRIGKRHHRVSIDEAIAHLPALARDRLAGAYVYYDAQVDDARLTLTLARTAAHHGAAIANYATVEGLVKQDERVVGARVVADGSEIIVRAECVVNATGVWADDVRALDEGRHPASVRPAKGVHVTIPRARLGNDIAAVIPAPGDRRSVFVIPWGDVTYIGTTDTAYVGPLDDPPCTHDDVEYLLGALNSVISDPVLASEVVGTWAGLRPLLRSARSERTADLSRRHAVRTAPSGVVTVTGGKLTTYRRMAADAVDACVRQLGARQIGGTRQRSRTKHLHLLGSEGIEPARLTNGIDAREHLVGRYGSEAAEVRALFDEDAGLADPLVPGLPYLRAEAVHGVRHEMARTLDDVLARRTRARLFARDATADAAPEVAVLLARELGWSAEERDAEVRSYRAAVDADRAQARS